MKYIFKSAKNDFYTGCYKKTRNLTFYRLFWSPSTFFPKPPPPPPPPVKPTAGPDTSK